MGTSRENQLTQLYYESERDYDTTYYQPYPVSDLQKINSNAVSSRNYYSTIEDADPYDSRIFKIEQDSVTACDYLSSVTQTTKFDYNEYQPGF